MNRKHSIHFRATKNCPWISAIWIHYLQFLESNSYPEETLQLVSYSFLCVNFLEKIPCTKFIQGPTKRNCGFSTHTITSSSMTLQAAETHTMETSCPNEICTTIGVELWQNEDPVVAPIHSKLHDPTTEHPRPPPPPHTHSTSFWY